MNQILPADIFGAAKILELQKLAYQSEAVLYDDWSIPPLTQTLDEIEKEFGEMTFHKVCDSGRFVRYIMSSIHDNHRNVSRLIVHPEPQHKGTGTPLMLAIETELPHVRRFELLTESKSEDNIRLYARLAIEYFTLIDYLCRLSSYLWRSCGSNLPTPPLERIRGALGSLANRLANVYHL